MNDRRRLPWAQGTGGSHTWVGSLKTARRTDTAGGGPETRCSGCRDAQTRGAQGLETPDFEGLNRAWDNGGHPKLLYFHSHRLAADGAALRMH